MKYTLKDEWMEGIDNLPTRIKAEVLGAIVLYQYNGTVASLSPMASSAFTMILPMIKDFSQKSLKMAENGRKRTRHTNAAEEHEEVSSGNAGDVILFGSDVEPKPKKETKYRYASNVLIKPSDYAVLVEQYGEEGAQWMVNKLNWYKVSYKKKYRDDYSAICKWVVEAYFKEMNSQSVQIPQTKTSSKVQQNFIEQQKSIELIKNIYDK